MFGGWGGGGGGSNQQEDAYYQARLRQYLKEQEESANLADSEQYHNAAKQIERQILDTPDLNDQEKTHRLATLGALQILSMRPNQGVSSLNDALQSLMAGTQNSGQLTEKQRNYNRALSEGYGGDFMKYQKDTEAQPMSLKEAAAMLNGSPELRDALLTLKGKNVTTEADLAGAKEKATQDAQVNSARTKEAEKDAGSFIVKQLGALPDAIYGYKSMINSAEGVQQKLDQIDQLVKDHPYAQGAVGEWMKTIPQTNAMDLDNLIKTIEANNVLKGMEMARANSPNGSTGFGALDTGEREGLAAQIAALKQASTPEAFQQAMKDLRAYYDNVRQVASDKWKADAEWNNRNLTVVPGVGREVGAAPEYKAWTDLQLEKQEAERQKLIEEIRKSRGGR
jgi:hypothetical protein